jgi:mono/diheme cytochrome c family protein
MVVRILGLTTALLLVATPLAWAADGATFYKAQCAKCHGSAGQADTAVAKKMKVKPIVGDDKLQAMSIDDIAGAIKGNAKHPSKVKNLSGDDLNAAAGYVKQLAAGK